MLSDRHISLRIWMLSQSSTFSHRLDGTGAADLQHHLRQYYSSVCADGGLTANAASYSSDLSALGTGAELQPRGPTPPPWAKRATSCSTTSPDLLRPRVLSAGEATRGQTLPPRILDTLTPRMLSTGELSSVGAAGGRPSMLAPPARRPASSNSTSPPLGDNVTNGTPPPMRPGSATDAVLRRSSLDLDLGSQPPACCRRKDAAAAASTDAELPPHAVLCKSFALPAAGELVRRLSSVHHPAVMLAAHREPATTTESEGSDSPSGSADALAHSTPLPQSLSADAQPSRQDGGFVKREGGTSFTKRREEGSFAKGRREDGSFTKGRSFKRDGSGAHGSAGAGSEAVAVSCFL